MKRQFWRLRKIVRLPYIEISGEGKTTVADLILG